MAARRDTYEPRRLSEGLKQFAAVTRGGLFPSPNKGMATWHVPYLPAANRRSVQGVGRKRTGIEMAQKIGPGRESLLSLFQERYQSPETSRGSGIRKMAGHLEDA